MLSLPTAVKIYLARGATDMRKSIDGLSGLVQHQLEQDPISGHLFVFCNARRDVPPGGFQAPSHGSQYSIGPR